MLLAFYLAAITLTVQCKYSADLQDYTSHRLSQEINRRLWSIQTSVALKELEVFAMYEFYTQV